MKSMKFKRNFNNKLDCNFFTSFRLEMKWNIDDNVIILCKEKFKIGKIIDVKKVHISLLTDWHCYLDAGMSKVETLSQLNEYYDIDVKSANCFLYYYLVRSIDYWHDLDHVQPFVEL